MHLRNGSRRRNGKRSLGKWVDFNGLWVRRRDGQDVMMEDWAHILLMLGDVVFTAEAHLVNLSDDVARSQRLSVDEAWIEFGSPRDKQRPAGGFRVKFTRTDELGWVPGPDEDDGPTGFWAVRIVDRQAGKASPIVYDLYALPKSGEELDGGD